jgi:hypothetical protein
MHKGEASTGPFAVVHDIAAPWDDHRYIQAVVEDPQVGGLILHAAGPTDDGYRTIDVWVSHAAWSRARDRWNGAFDDLVMPPVVRELHVSHLAPPTPLPKEQP